MSNSHKTDYSEKAKSEIGLRSPIPPRKTLKYEENKDDQYYKTPSFPSLPSLSIRMQNPKRSESTLGKYSQSEPMLNRRLPKLTLSKKIIPSSSTQQKRKLKRQMDRDNWRSNNGEQRKLRTTYYPDHSFSLRNKFPAPQTDIGVCPSMDMWGTGNCETKSDVYVPGKRCGIIPVDTRTDSNGKKVTSLLVVMGRPTLMENGRAMNIWSFGKGRMMETESEEKCAIREFWEETGILLPTVNNLPRIELGKNVYFILHTTREAMPTEQLAIKDILEVQDVAWKTVDDLREIENRISPDQRVNKDVRAVIKYPARTFHYHRLIFNPETKHPVQDVRELADRKAPRVGSLISASHAPEQDKTLAAS